jgi:hypothetical protein
MSRSYTPLPPSASMACSGTALPFTLHIIDYMRLGGPQSWSGNRGWGKNSLPLPLKRYGSYNVQCLSTSGVGAQGDPCT